MSDARRYRDDFGPFGGRAWINCAHQGPLPAVAVEAAHAALAWKRDPASMDDAAFFNVPDRLRGAIAKLIGATPDHVVLGNSASYGLHLLANGLRWNSGDEVLLVHGDFPATAMPWAGLDARGVTVRTFAPSGRVPSADELRDALTPRTRVFCASWVNSFNGGTLDLEALGSLCRERAVRFVINGSQAIGARPLDVSRQPVDAVTSCGYKWLCGPYGTGFLWLSPSLATELDYNQNYWLAAQGRRPLASMQEYEIRPLDDVGPRRWDVFCTANFLNSMPWLASLEYLDDAGIGQVAAHDDVLVDALVDGLRSRGYGLLSPERGDERSMLVVASHADASRNREVHDRLAAAGVDVAFREGNLRFSPHLYNTIEDVGRALEALAASS